MSELKPCPFCGAVAAEGLHKGDYGYTYDRWYVCCPSGCAKFSFETEEYDWNKREHRDVLHLAKKKARNRWNNRPLETALEKQESMS